MTLTITCSPHVDVLPATRVLARVPPLVIIVLSLTVLIAMVLAPCFVGAAEKARTSEVRGIMRTVQIAAESYAAVTGKYPDGLSDLEPFLPTGSNSWWCFRRMAAESLWQAECVLCLWEIA